MNGFLSLHASSFFVLVALFLLIVPQSADAYIDPGGVSFILQALLATAVAGVVTARLYWQRFTTYMRGLFSHKKNVLSSAEVVSPQPADPGSVDVKTEE